MHVFLFHIQTCTVKCSVSCIWRKILIYLQDKAVFENFQTVTVNVVADLKMFLQGRLENAFI